MSLFRRNDKGMSLVELLAAVTISALVLGVATTLFVSIQSTLTNSNNKYQEHATEKLTLDTLTKQLTDATQAVYYSAHREFRYRTGNQYKTLVQSGSAAPYTLTLYDLQDTTGTNFASSAVSLSSHPSLYTNPRQLTGSLESISYTYGSSNTALGTTVLKNGELLTLSVSFQIRRNKLVLTDNPPAAGPARSVSVLLLKDTSTK